MSVYWVASLQGRSTTNTYILRAQSISNNKYTTVKWHKERIYSYCENELILAIMVTPKVVQKWGVALVVYWCFMCSGSAVPRGKEKPLSAHSSPLAMSKPSVALTPSTALPPPPAPLHVTKSQFVLRPHQ